MKTYFPLQSISDLNPLVIKSKEAIEGVNEFLLINSASFSTIYGCCQNSFRRMNAARENGNTVKMQNTNQSNNN